MDINLSDFPGNPKKNPPPEDQPEEAPRPAIEKVSVTVVKTKKRWYDRLAETFFGQGENAKSVWDYLIQDILVPAAKDTITDMVSSGFERLIYGEEARPRGRGPIRRGGDNHTPYDKASYRTPTRGTQSRGVPRGNHNFDDLALSSRREADEVLFRMREYAYQYKEVTVSDFLELLGEPTTPVDHYWGWTLDTLKAANVGPVRGGFVVLLPPTIRLED